jgi:hypothetical protein
MVWHMPALAFGGEANVPDIVIMGVGGLGFAVHEGLFKERRIYSSLLHIRADFLAYQPPGPLTALHGLDSTFMRGFLLSAYRVVPDFSDFWQ